MKIRDSFAVINGDTSIIEMPSGGIEVVAEDGGTLFTIRLTSDGVLEVNGGRVCKHNGVMLDDLISVKPVAANLVYILKDRYR